MIRTDARGAGRGKALVLGFSLSTLLAAMLLFAAGEPAHGRLAPIGKTFTVNFTGDGSDGDPGDGVCDTSPGGVVLCTLRAAIEEANETVAADTIRFNIGGTPGQVRTISPTSDLPSITQRVTIDGYTQPGASANTLAKGTNAVLKIELDGSNPATTVGLKITASNTTVRGLVINRFAAGVNLADTPSTTGNRLEGSFIGTDPTGTQDRGNSTDGVFVLGTNTTVGGTTRAARNLISGNDDNGVSLSSAATDGKVQGNLIGTQADGTSDLGNDDHGVFSQGSNHTVGGDSVAAANTIAFNGQDGVLVFSGTANRILRNSIFSNGGLGIDLKGGTENAAGATQNDLQDPDIGPNDLQNKPALTSASTSGGSTTVVGTLNSTPNKAFTIQFFSNSNEGKVFRGQKNVTTNANGNAPFTFVTATAVPAGQFVTATATGAGNTSEFSAPRAVT